MSIPAARTGRRWDKVELFASYSLLVLLATVLITRLSFDTVWVMPKIDLVLSWASLLAVAVALWQGRWRRWLRVGAVAFASITQLVPMVVREPELLFPLIGAIVPVAILVIALAALSRKPTVDRDNPVGAPVPDKMPAGDVNGDTPAIDTLVESAKPETKLS